MKKFKVGIPVIEFRTKIIEAKTPEQAIEFALIAHNSPSIWEIEHDHYEMDTNEWRVEEVKDLIPENQAINEIAKKPVILGKGKLKK